MTANQLAYAFQETADASVKKVLIKIPARWGRMPPLSRAVVVEAGKLLHREKLLDKSLNQLEQGRTAGLIGGTRWGSHTTDIAFSDSMKDNVNFASPALFGYTLANIPLAEAANHFGLTGPVYAIIDQKNPYAAACEEAQRLLQIEKSVDMMLACEFDAYYSTNTVEQLSVTFTLYKNHD